MITLIDIQRFTLWQIFCENSIKTSEASTRTFDKYRVVTGTFAFTRHIQTSNANSIFQDFRNHTKHYYSLTYDGGATI
jgi:hypothetical protein